MAASITLKPNVELGVVPTHLKFVGGLVPDDDGKLPRGDDGKLLVNAEMERLAAASPVQIDCVQVPTFPGVDPNDTKDLITGLQGQGLNVHTILMVGGANPMNPDDEDAVVEMLVSGANVAKQYGVADISSTSIEEWMTPGATRKTGADFDAAVAQNAKVHSRVYEEAGLAGSAVKNWHIEFLRGGEFQTFTNIERAGKVVSAINETLGNKFFKLLVDAAHCGDSDLSIPENEAFIAKLAERDELGIFHCSSKTTRGCLTTDDGWIGALLAAAANTGKLKTVFVEAFHHEDPALQGLRDLDPRHGVDTRDGRTYSELVIDGVVDTARRLNNLAARGMCS